MRKIVLIAFTVLISFQILAQVPSYVPTNGLVGWWPFTGNANDSSGNGNNGTVSGATLTTDRFGNANKAYSFSGSANDKINFNLPNNISNNFTILIWVRPNRSINMLMESNVCPVGVSVPLAFSNQNWAIQPNQIGNPDIGSGGISVGDNGIMSAEHGVNILVSRHSYTSSFKSFTCVALVYRTDSNFLYINGVPVRSKAVHCAGSNKTISQNLQLGGNLYSPPFFGIIDELGMWNRALTQQEITNLYNSCNTPAPSGDNLQTFCSSATLSNLSVLGTNIKWYASSKGGGQLSPFTALVNGFTYYATQTLNGCESLNRLPVKVVINNAQLVTNSNNMCGGATAKLSINLGMVQDSIYTIRSIGPAGGYVFYDKGNSSNGWRYLEVAPNDISTAAEWGCNGSTISGVSNIVGTGFSNTNLILLNCSTPGIAARVCDQATINGYSDWYLPSKGDFDLIYQNLHLQGLGNFINNTGPNNSVKMYNRYWTSSQVSLPNGWAQDFSPYYQQVNSKSEPSRVRPIRQFAPSISTYLWSTGATTASINVTPYATTQYWVDITTNGVTCRKFITIQVTNNTTNIIPTVLNAKINDTGVFTSTKTIGSEIIWQSNNANLGWSNLAPNQNYQLYNSSKTLQINDLKVQNHLHKFRVISTLNGCKDTSNIAYIQISDTCITKINDTIKVTKYDTIKVTDTLVINATLSGVSAPNNANRLLIYPNPAKDHITIDYGVFGRMSGYTLKIVNTLGQIVFSTPINQQTSYINLSTWTGKGMYYVQIYDASNTLTENRKIVLQ